MFNLKLWETIIMRVRKISEELTKYYYSINAGNLYLLLYALKRPMNASYLIIYSDLRSSVIKSGD